jgi:alkanesulfonate monooxygenase SsuD/methylene tetrahydromethanopterin reductase-like flavin-dependent oxidoreductase (luciferase family)
MPDMTRPFRFGVVAPVLTDPATWRDRVHRIADLGYSTLLMPDVPLWQPAPAAALAVAAALEADLRVGTWVYAVPFRPPWNLAWEAHSLTTLTDGRFELGLGTGRPGIEDELRERGMPVPSPGERLSQVRETVAQLRELDGPDGHTPVVMAVRGPKAQALAAEVADTVTFVLRPADTREDVADLVRGFPPGRDVELALHVPVVGDGVAAFMASAREIDSAALHEADSMLVLSDDPRAAIEEVQRRREEMGFSYVVIGADFAETMAPAVAALTGT